MADSPTNELSTSPQVIESALNSLEIEPRSHRWFDGLLRCLKPMWVVSGKSNLHELKEHDWEICFEDIKDLQFLGSGAQGAVFSGFFKGEWVAVKKVRERTDTDIKHLKKLSHNNIVAFKGVCVHPPCYCIIMEFCPSGTLHSLLHQGTQVPPRMVTEWSKQVASGMHYLHSHKIIHRDLKSENILIGQNDTLKISDFGTSKQWNEKSIKMSFAGTVAWMAPEVIRNELCTEKVDIWSFGVVLWELLTCETPYRGVDSSAIIWGVGSNSLHLPIPSTCPDGFRLLLRQCWNTKPKNRPSFRHIMMHVEIAAVEILSTPEEQYFETQVTWKQEIGSYMQNIRNDICYGLLAEEDLIKKRQEELKHAQDIRIHYEQKLERANSLYMELMACFQHVENNKGENVRSGISIQQASGAAKLVKKNNRRYMKNNRLNKSKLSMESEVTIKHTNMKYSAYHSPSAARIRRTKYYSTYPRAQKSPAPFRRTKSLNLKRRSRLPHSIDSETQTEDNELPSSISFRRNTDWHNSSSEDVNSPELLSSKLSSMKLHSEHCESIPFSDRVNPMKQDCVVCFMLSQHVHNNHNERCTDRPNRLFRKHQTISRIRSFLKSNLRRYSSTQDITKESCDTSNKKSFRWSFFGTEKTTKFLNGKCTVQKLVSSLSFPNIPLSVSAEA